MNDEFPRIKRLPPYVFNIVNDLKAKARARGEDIIDFGMGNPDKPAPKHIVDKLVEAAQRPDTHRYSVSRGIPRLRKAICDWYQRKFDVDLDPDSETIVTIGSKEGLAHLALATVGPGDAVLVPNPAYPIHPYGFVIAGADIRHVPLTPDVDFFAELEKSVKDSWPKPKMLVLNFPGNPTTQCVELDFFERIVEFARELEIQGMETVKAAIKASRMRLRPILMTSFAFIMGVVPMVLSTGAGSEMRNDIGITVFSGMLGVTFFGLFFTPVFYVLLRKLEGRRRYHSHVVAD